LTRTEADADWVAVPSVPVTVTVRLPFLALEVTVTVSVAVPFPPANEVVGPTATEMPVVAPLADRFTVPLYPVLGVTTTEKVAEVLPLVGRFTVCEFDGMLMLKVGAAGAETASVADVVCVREPSVPEIVKL
jgi:hypothetical protein